MNREQDVLFLFTIAKEIERSYHCPVILLTQKDFADNIYRTLTSLRCALLKRAATDTIRKIVNTSHFNWLQAVQDVEDLQKRVRDTPRESVFKSLDYTLDCIKNRHDHFRKYMNHINLVKTPLSPTEKALIQDELQTIKDMEEIYACALRDKQKYLMHSSDKEEFANIVLNEIKELLNWLDELHDYLALQVCKLLDLPQLPAELCKALQDEIDEMASFLTSKPGVASAMDRGKKRCKALRMIHTFPGNSISRIVTKIKKLENRIAQLKNEKSSPGVLALQHKTIFLEDCLEYLKNLKVTLSFIQKKKSTQLEDYENDTTEENKVYNIFNHLLPHEERSHLVDKLVRLWKNAIDNPDNKSLISIIRKLSSDVFSDDIMLFTVDKYGRQIYTKAGDCQDYQLNASNTLIPINDDEHHVYFYDEFGRYYLTENSDRVYKNHRGASEYILHRTGEMLKVQETVDGVEYQYDTLGRFYTDDGQKTYCDRGSTDKYRPDDLGNLVKIRDVDQHDLVLSPVEPITTEDSFYLKKTVGEALKKCVAEVVLVLPIDPIQYLADGLKKYHFDMESKKKRQLERQEMMAEQRLHFLEPESKSKPEKHTEPEKNVDANSGIDYNFLNYQKSAV